MFNLDRITSYFFSLTVTGALCLHWSDFDFFKCAHVLLCLTPAGQSRRQEVPQSDADRVAERHHHHRHGDRRPHRRRVHIQVNETQKPGVRAKAWGRFLDIKSALMVHNLCLV